MQLPLQITFRNIPPSPAIDANIRKKAAQLDHFAEHIMACRVVVEAPHRRHHQGMLYHVRIDLTVPGGELALSREPAADHAHEDVFVAIRDAFDATVRQLEDHVRRRRARTKLTSHSHMDASHGSSPARTTVLSRRRMATRSISTATACSGMASTHSNWETTCALPKKRAREARRPARCARLGSITWWDDRPRGY